MNDLVIDNGIAHIWKYVDDTNVSEVVIKGRASNAQQIADNVAKWSSDNRVKLNSDKCKELRISFAKRESHFAPVNITFRLERVISTHVPISLKEGSLVAVRVR